MGRGQVAAPPIKDTFVEGAFYSVNPRIIRRLIVFFVGTVACVGTLYLGVLLFFANALSGLGHNSCPPETPSMVEEMARFKLPPSASNLKSYCWGMQGAVASATFNMEPTDLEFLLHNSKVDTPLSTTVQSYDMNIAPCCLTDFMYGQHREGEIFQKILIDRSKYEIYTVYIETLLG